MRIFRILFFCLVVAGCSIVLLPVYCLRPFNPRNTSHFLKTLRLFLGPVFGLSKEIIDRHKYLDNLPGVAVGNHQHNWDILMASMAFSERTVFLGKSQISFIPIFGQLFLFAGNVTVNRGDSQKAMASMLKVERILKRWKVGVVIFPEGHRNPTQTLLPFKKGAFRSAIVAQVPILPFSVNLYCKQMDLGRRLSGTVKVKFHDPIPTVGLTAKDMPELMERTRQVIQQGMDELNRPA